MGFRQIRQMGFRQIHRVGPPKDHKLDLRRHRCSPLIHQANFLSIHQVVLG